ncbi:hypothetical protein SPLC1_S412100 [Arthrospira platensis C1]|nr:hypothetical protein SPLC1_S412100 [Arthrospira platensis C1]
MAGSGGSSSGQVISQISSLRVLVPGALSQKMLIRLLKTRF